VVARFFGFLIGLASGVVLVLALPFHFRDYLRARRLRNM
jgi:hypothetical protein